MRFIITHFPRRTLILIAVAALMPSGCKADTAAQPAPVAAEAPSKMPYIFGTLMPNQSNAQKEYAAGIRSAQVDVFWKYLQKTDGGWDANSWNEKKHEIQTFMDTGMKVALGIGFQYPPDWIFNYPNSRYLNQDGHNSAKEVVNFTFNQKMRDKGEAYMDKLFAQWGDINQFWAIRIGSGPYVEVFYPGMDDGAGQTNSYWAWDANASGTASDRPATIPARPFPNWKPGDKTISTAQVRQWYAWYMAAQMDTVNWQIDYLRNKQHYTGYIQVLMPGIGTRPSEFTTSIDNDLNGTGDPSHTTGRGAVWNQVIDGIRNKDKVVISITDLGKGSGENDFTQPGDAALVIGRPADDQKFLSWSAARWISYNADRYGLTKTGETPGEPDKHTMEVLNAAVRQMDGCHLQGLQWAHSKDLYSGRPTEVSLADFQAVIQKVETDARQATPPTAP